MRTPPETVVAAMPGTLLEIVERTGYPIASVLTNLTRARRQGVPVRAVMQSRSPDDATTIFTVEPKEAEKP